MLPSDDYEVIWTGRQSLLPERESAVDTRYETIPSFDLDEDDCPEVRSAKRIYRMTGKHKGKTDRNHEYIHKGVTFDTVREDGRLERHCKHGIGHTVGHIRGYLLDTAETVHGCCGMCCVNYKKQEIKKVEGEAR